MIAPEDASHAKPPPLPTPASIVREGVPCISCGYSLRGLMSDMPCPECGRAIADSLAVIAPSLSAGQGAALHRALRLVDHTLSTWVVASLAAFFAAMVTGWLSVVSVAQVVRGVMLLVGGIALVAHAVAVSRLRSNLPSSIAPTSSLVRTLRIATWMVATLALAASALALYKAFAPATMRPARLADTVLGTIYRFSMIPYVWGLSTLLLLIAQALGDARLREKLHSLSRFAVAVLVCFMVGQLSVGLGLGGLIGTISRIAGIFAFLATLGMVWSLASHTTALQRALRRMLTPSLPQQAPAPPPPAPAAQVPGPAAHRS